MLITQEEQELEVQVLVGALVLVQMVLEIMVEMEALLQSLAVPLIMVAVALA
jgi:hypothetical protein